ncbi:malonyl-CoA:anthocyanidin 5-O-glucoside-6''-O-malonyltransferase-like [Cucurbita pepo subsp. pepo]|uniref:malonyl-CoA:anthocyanidin 5-O-glucoside-6''-O-malonyltransferase-like n=1 Tax=Cucurbita pepo subsp. pepo TaxID=3664 RepID=UPI000C9D6ECB|nr:malonyl-CoA:anthocyanidin 5-O-glucoside-6''-O-malonyltransferase-like [Cucurbita pepo subsp. pepo]
MFESKFRIVNIILLGSKLLSNMSLTLSHFLPLAGNLVWPHHSPEPLIVYNPGDSVSLTIAKTEADFHHLSSNHVRKAKESHFLVPQLPTSDTIAPTMSLQITLFPKSGFSIGIVTNHVVVDGKTSTMFLKSWASICSTLNSTTNNNNLPTLPSELTPCFDRTAARDPNGLQRLYVKYFGMFVRQHKILGLTPKRVISNDVVYATFELTRIDIEKLRRKVATNSTSTRYLTTFVLTFSLISTCIVKAERIEQKSKIALFFAMDMRPRMGALGGLNYFGNGVSTLGVFLEAKELEEENGMAMVANKISDRMMEIERSVKENKVVEMVEEILGGWGREMPISKMIGVGGSPRFGVYEIDFGWGNSKKVEMASMDPNGTFSMTESRSGNGGVEVGIALPNDVMNVFSSLFYEEVKE